MKKALSVFLSIIVFFSTISSLTVISSAKTSVDGLWKYIVLDDGTVSITSDTYDLKAAYLGSDTHVIVPSVIDGYTVTSIGMYAFNSCATLISLTIPNTVKEIREGAFQGCSLLEEVMIPDTVIKIGSNAFASCSSLKNIPNGVKDISPYMFSGCSSLTTVSIPNGVTSIGEGAFYGCTSLISVSIPNSVTCIVSSAFSRCTSLTSIRIPGSVTSLMSGAFSGCTSLTSIIIEEGVTGINRNAFEDTAYYMNDTNWENNVLYIDNYLISVKKDISGSCEIKDGTVGISDYAFDLCKSLESVTIPGSLKSIPDGIEGGIFSYCRSLKSVTICNGVKSIGNGAFCGCTSLASIALPDSITEIGNNAFYGCSALSDVSFGNEVKHIGADAFFGCNLIEEVVIPDSIDEIGLRAFFAKDKETNTNYCYLKTIYGYSGSYAEQYANEKGVTFISLGEMHIHSWKMPKYIWINDYSTVVATRICQINNSHIESESVNTVSQIIIEESCENEGTVRYTATFENTAFETQTKDVTVPALGHDWGEVTYEWADDNSICTATRICSRDASHIETETVNTTSVTVTESGCEAEGTVRYTATFENTAFETQTKDITVAAIGHDWGEATYEWSSDNKTCTATRICLRDASHIETETVNTTIYEIEANYSKTGKIIFTASFENEAFEEQTKTVETPAYIYFPDVTRDAWYYDAVQYCAQNKYINGYQDGRFGPNDPLQRQDFVVILANIAKADLSAYTSCKLKDVDINAYYGKAVAWAVDKGIIAGYQNGKFGVGDPITREQVATILYRYMGSPTVTGVNSKLAKFPDKANISEFAKTPLAWAVENNIISGMQDGTVAPKGTAVRAQIASIIMRMDQNGMFDPV